MEKAYAEKLNKKFIIATAPSRFSKNWKNTEISWGKLLDKLRETTRTRETVEEYRRMNKSDQGSIKDVGGFVGGSLKEGHRKAENVANRSLLTLDLDFVSSTASDLWLDITMFFGNEMCIYSTHAHRDKNTRIRLIIPTDRPMLPDEYQAVGRMVASDIGIDQFDDTTFEPSRLMYWPSTSADGEYIFKHQRGDFLKVDRVLSRYRDWRDTSEWPLSSRQTSIIERSIKKQENPLEKKGMVGYFCRTYTIVDAIEEYLSDVYEPTKNANRYTFKGGSTFGGLVVYKDLFAYSHHGTDPIGGQLCNAFDLVRIHLYNELDEDVKEGTPITRYPSYLKMVEVANNDKRVKITIGEDRQREIHEDFEFKEKEEKEVNLNWMVDLETDRKGEYLNTIDNMVIVMDNDPLLKDRLKYNSFANRAIVLPGVPWGSFSKEHDWQDMDDSGLHHYLEKYYQLSHASKMEDAKNIIFDKYKFHPVREYLNSLNWDGIKRVDTLLIDYLGAEDTLYTREAIKIHLAAAVSRVMNPGCKYDQMVTLAGKQGIGKSTFIALLAGEWFSDSMENIRGKEAAEQIQGMWMIEMGELSAARKADRDAFKAFLSKRDDVYRVAYAKNTTRFPRQCIFWGTSNEMNFLRDPTGERRSYPIDCGINKPSKDIWTLLPKERDQIWAEAVQIFKNGQKLYMTGEALKLAQEQQELHKEDEPLKGVIEAYLEDDYPSNWYDLPLFERKNWIAGEREGTEYSSELMKLNKICIIQIGEELLGKRKSDIYGALKFQISDVLRSLSGWEQHTSNMRFGKIYGKQKGYVRK